MELEIFEALTAANVPADKARAAAASVKREIDERYSLHAAQLATRGDVADVKTSVESVRREVAETKAEMVKWFVGTIIAVAGITAALLKLML
jgi:predicted translin family RNA/ssDNA-binding protein